MANPTSVDVGPAVIVLAAATPVTVELNPERSYRIRHNGLAEAGTADTHVVFGVCDSGVPSLLRGDGRFIIPSAENRIIGPKVDAVVLDCSAGGVPTLTIEHYQYFGGRQ